MLNSLVDANCAFTPSSTKFFTISNFVTSELTIDPAEVPEDAEGVEPDDAEGLRKTQEDDERAERDRVLTDEEDQ